MASFQDAYWLDTRLGAAYWSVTSRLDPEISDWCLQLERTVESAALRERIFNEITPGLAELRQLFKRVAAEFDSGPARPPRDNTLLDAVEKASDLYFAYFKPKLRRATCRALDVETLRAADRAIDVVRRFLEQWCMEGHKLFGRKGSDLQERLPREEFDTLMMKILIRGRNIRIEAVREAPEVEPAPSVTIFGTLFLGNKRKLSEL
jgi:hypothetical protein